MTTMRDRRGEKIPVLDHGFVRLVDWMGDDDAIVQAARVSYGSGTKSVSDDKALIDYLMRHRHTTPFEMCEIKLHIKLPIFVARQWIRHRTGSFNEVSARYSVVPGEFYVPDAENIRAQSSTNKQGRDEQPMKMTTAAAAHAVIYGSNVNADKSYRWLLSDPEDGGEVGGAGTGESGVARELARIVLPLSTYTEWYWKVDLHNLLHFLQLRLDSHAQYEIRIYAETIARIVENWVPLAWEAFENHRRNAVTLSRNAFLAIAQLAIDAPPMFVARLLKANGVSRRECQEIMAAIRDRGPAPEFFEFSPAEVDRIYKEKT